MRGEASPYSILGVDPGADPADVERAYKRLIKQHHPDREGGDARRAAEINRAYRELRGPFPPHDMALFADSAHEPGGNAWVRAAMALIVALATLLLVTGPVTAYVHKLLPRSARLPGRQVAGATRAADPMDQPLHSAAVAAGVRDAERLASRRDENAVLSESRDCHRLLRMEPSVARLDRCAAFDDAVAELEDRDPMWDRGPFSALSITGRQWSSASALSNDYLAIDGRLDRIRLQVELALAGRS